MEVAFKIVKEKDGLIVYVRRGAGAGWHKLGFWVTMDAVLEVIRKELLNLF